MTFRFTTLLLAVLVSAGLPATAKAEDTLKQKQGWEQYAASLATKVDSVNGKCGSSFSASFDQSTYKDFDPIEDRTQAACLAAVDTIGALCMSEAGKSAAKALTKASCKFSTTGTNVSKSGSELTINIDPVKSSINGKKPGNYSWKSALEEVL